jgi:cytochrome P450
MAPALAISHDPSIYPNPDEFDGLRFYNIRAQSPAAENKYQFSSTSKHMVHFGAGRHACPGRAFASAQAKMVIAMILQNFDLKFKEGEERPNGNPSQHTRPLDPFAEVLFRKRNV